MSEQNRRKPEALPESASLLLDAIRFTAAIMVVIGHLTHPEFELGFANRQVLGDIAVPVFFVLSGFVIRYVTRTRGGTGREYLIDRACRIYSVALPALAFSVAVGGVCFLIDRHRFLTAWASTFHYPVMRLVLNLSFLSQAWGHNYSPFGNGAFWSLGYECIYYVLYGFLFFFRGWTRILLFALLAVGIGPQVMLLFPIWWLGCWTYDVYVRVRGTRWARILLTASAGYLAAGWGAGLAGYWGVLEAPGWLFTRVAGLPNPIVLLGMNPSRASVFGCAVGLFCPLPLLLCLLAVDGWEIARSNWWAKAVRQLANGTFSVYLLHYPFLVLLLFLGLLAPRQVLANVGVVSAMCAVMVALALPMDRLKLLMRRQLRQKLPAAAPVIPAAASVIEESLSR